MTMHEGHKGLIEKLDYIIDAYDYEEFDDEGNPKGYESPGGPTELAAHLEEGLTAPWNLGLVLEALIAARMYREGVRDTDLGSPVLQALGHAAGEIAIENAKGDAE